VAGGLEGQEIGMVRTLRFGEESTLRLCLVGLRAEIEVKMVR